MSKSPTGALLALALLVAVVLATIEGSAWPLQWWLVATPITLFGQAIGRWPLNRQAASERKRAIRLVMASEAAAADGSRHRVAEVLQRARELIRLAERLEHQIFDLEPRPVGAHVEASIERFQFSENPVTDMVAAHAIEREADELARSAIQRYTWRRGSSAA